MNFQLNEYICNGVNKYSKLTTSRLFFTLNKMIYVQVDDVYCKCTASCKTSLSNFLFCDRRKWVNGEHLQKLVRATYEDFFSYGELVAELTSILQGSSCLGYSSP